LEGSSDGVTHQVSITALRMITFVGHGKLNFNLTEKSVVRHYRHSKIRLNTHFLTMFRLQPARAKQSAALVTNKLGGAI
jgi:hypothetical protein